MTNPTDMTKAETNKAIAELVYPDAHIFSNNYSKVTVDRMMDGRSCCIAVDYCNNWNDLMTLVEKHKILHTWIELKTGASHWVAYKKYIGYHDKEVSAWDIDSLQLALAECLLQVLKAKEQT